MRIRKLVSRIAYRAGVTRAHGSLPSVHVASRSRWSYGRAFVALLLISRAFSFSIGCSPADGSLGGKCTTHTDDCTGHIENDYCNDGVCNETTNICVAAPPATPEPPPTPSCTQADRGTCSADQISFACVGDASPDAIDCTLSSSYGSSSAEYCCTPSASTCVAVTVQSSPCSAPAQYFSCLYYGVTPSVAEDDASLRCVVLPSYRDYCCASGDACFSAPIDDQDWCGSRSAYFCPGSTPPDAGNCERMDASPESNGLEAYCCDAPAALDAGGD